MRHSRKTSPHAAPDPMPELLNMDAVLVPDLPVPVTMWLTIEGAPARVQLTTLERAAPDAGELEPWEEPRLPVLADVIVFDREELRALVTAVQADRVWRKDLLAACFDKWRRPEHRLTLREALAGANEDANDWSLARVLARVGATVEAVEIGVPSAEERPLSAAA
jgi:hypothetical protein